jgi:hypothetical protein
MIATSMRGPLVAVFGLYLAATTAASLLVRSAFALATATRRGNTGSAASFDEE